MLTNLTLHPHCLPVTRRGLVALAARHDIFEPAKEQLSNSAWDITDAEFWDPVAGAIHGPVMDQIILELIALRRGKR